MVVAVAAVVEVCYDGGGGGDGCCCCCCCSSSSSSSSSSWSCSSCLFTLFTVIVVDVLVFSCCVFCSVSIMFAVGCLLCLVEGRFGFEYMLDGPVRRDQADRAVLRTLTFTTSYANLCARFLSTVMKKGWAWGGGGGVGGGGGGGGVGGMSPKYTPW